MTYILPIPINTKQIQSFCQQYAVAKLSLFGSVLREDFTIKSDVDFLVEFTPENVPSFFTLSDMQDDLSTIVQRVVDLRTPEELSPYFRDQVLTEALVIYGSN